jgi:ribosomal protein S18 acetylase RimI-like enzyme
MSAIPDRILSRAYLTVNSQALGSALRGETSATPGPLSSSLDLQSDPVTYRKATIRPYAAEDESRLFSLAREAFGEQERWSDRTTIARLETDTVFVADLEGDQAGYVALKREGDAVRIEQLLVSPRHEHEGIGRQLVEYAEGFAISEGAVRLQIVVEADNRRALDFYHGRGFTEAGENLFELRLPQASS